MKIKIITSIFLFLAFAIPSKAVITISTTVTWTTSQNINCDIEIVSGGTLYVYSNVRMAQGTRITIKDGGKLYASGANFYGNSNSPWQGIYVEPTFAGNNNAQNLIAFKIFKSSIHDAVVGIEFEKGYLRNYEIKGSKFFNNENHLLLYENYKLPAHQGKIISTQFLSATGFWPVNLYFSYNTSFYNCTFDYAQGWETGSTACYSQTGMHLEHSENLTIRNCKFRKVGAYGMSLHGFTNKAVIEKNNFLPIPCYDIGAFWHHPQYHYVAIDTEDHNFLNNTMTYNLKIRENSFDNSTWVIGNTLPGDLACGILLDGAPSTNLLIEKNNFINYAYGVDMEGAKSGICEMSSNTFDGYITAVNLRNDNSELYMTCNKFKTGDIAINATLNPSLQHHTQNGEDPGNQFINPTISFIHNLTSGFLDYNKDPINNPHPLGVITGVTAIIVNNTKKCAKGGGGTGDDGPPIDRSQKEEKTDDLVGLISPNPVSVGQILEVQVGKNALAYSLYGMDGRIIIPRTAIQGSKIVLDDLRTAGMFFIAVESATDIVTKRIIVMD